MQERQVMGTILRSVPPEMVQVLAAKDNAKAAWDTAKTSVPPEMVQVLAAKDNAKAARDTAKTMRIGVDRVQEVRRQKLRKDYDGLAFKSGETVEDFSLRVSSLISELQTLGDMTTELDGVEKILCVVPTRYAQMACSLC
jgi:hypothetical protein